MRGSFNYLKNNPIIVEELKKRCIIGDYLNESANANFYISKTNPDNLIKVFNCHDSNDIIIIDRNNDFVNEIEVLKCLQKTLVDGITQIKDSGTFKVHNIFATYYEMPRYEKYDKNKSAINILKDFIYLFRVLGHIHLSGYIHLDIKPDNIMTCKDNPVIIDFGCAQKKSGKIKIPKGPKWFKPPELMDRSTSDENLQYDINYEKSDIYMMSKTLWAVLHNGMYEKGFYGDYNRNYLFGIREKLKTNCEPLNILLENTIVTDWEQRLSINECMRLLENQIKILYDEYNENNMEIEKFINYDLLEQLHIEKPSILVYEDGVGIEKIVKTIKEIKIYKKKINLISDRIKILDLRVFEFDKELLKPVSENHYIIKYSNKSINIVIKRINVYESSRNQESMNIELADVNDFKDKLTLLPQLSKQENDVTSGKYYLDSNYEIIVEFDSNDEKLSIGSLFK